MEVINKEQELKELIKSCPINELEQLAIMMQVKETMQYNVMQLFNSQSKEILEKQLSHWGNLLIDKNKKHKKDNSLMLLTEENQNILFFNSDFTNKELVYMFYKDKLGIDYYKTCIDLMKKTIKNK